MNKPNSINDPVQDDGKAARDIDFERVHHTNMSAILFDNLSRNPGRIAIYEADKKYSYQELCARAAQAGNGLKALDLAKGTRIVMVLDDRADYAAAFFGAVRLGLVPVLVNVLSPAEQIAYFLQDSDAPVLFIEAEFLTTLGPALKEARDLRQIVVVAGDVPEGLDIAANTFEDFIAGHDIDLEPAKTDPDDMAFWMYSSGSTGKPKGVVHLHHDAAYTELSFAKSVLKLKPEDIIYSVPKIFFAYGFGNSVTFPFSAGAGVVLTPGRPKPDDVFTAIERFRPSVFCGLPTLYNALIAYEGAKARDLSSLRLCISAAEILPEETFNAWHSHYGLEIIEGLGSTELLHMYLSNLSGDYRLGSAGKAVPGYDIELRDTQGAQIAQGEEGIMWVRGHSSAPTYWNRPEATSDTMREDWVYTGDRFRLDDQGFYYFLGRADDLIKVSGQWIYPLEIEHCLGDHPAIIDCAVLGLAKPDGLMTTKAFVELGLDQKPGEALIRELQDFVKSRLLPYKYPREIVFLDAMPKTGTGKIDRQKLKTDHEKELKKA